MTTEEIATDEKAAMTAVSDDAPDSANPENEAEEIVKVGFIRRVMNGLSTPFPEDADKKAMTKDVVYIAWPAMAESFLLHLADMVNVMMVGSIGTWAISSIGYCTQPRQLLLTVFQAFNTGSTALIARAKGAGNVEEANKIMHQSMFFSLALSVLIALIGYTFATPLVKFMGAYEDRTILAATRHFHYIMMSFPFNVLTLSITANLRGIGRSRAAMIYNVISNVINVAVCFLFIEGRFGLPELGVAGASLGIASGQIIASAIAFILILRGADILKFRIRELFVFDKVLLGRVTHVGTPAMFNQFFMRFGNTMFTKIISSLGTEAFATHQIANNILSMTMMNGQAFGVSATSLLGQSMGKKRPDMAKAYVQLCRRYAMFISIAMMTGLVLLGRQLAGLYTTEPAVIAQCAVMLMIVAVVQPLQSSQQTLAGALRGAGDTKAIAFCTLMTVCTFRPISSWLFVNIFNWGLLGVWISMTMDQALRSCYTMWRFSSDKWKLLKV